MYYFGTKELSFLFVRGDDEAAGAADAFGVFEGADLPEGEGGGVVLSRIRLGLIDIGFVEADISRKELLRVRCREEAFFAAAYDRMESAFREGL